MTLSEYTKFIKALDEIKEFYEIDVDNKSMLYVITDKHPKRISEATISKVMSYSNFHPDEDSIVKFKDTKMLYTTSSYKLGDWSMGEDDFKADYLIYIIPKETFPEYYL